MHRQRAVRLGLRRERAPQGWIERWQANGWKTAAKKPVENQDLWRELLAEEARHTVRYELVKGHAGHELNERADALAVAARERLSSFRRIAVNVVRSARGDLDARSPERPGQIRAGLTDHRRAMADGDRVRVEARERGARRLEPREHVDAEPIAGTGHEERDRADGLGHDEQPPRRQPEGRLVPAPRAVELARLDPGEAAERAERAGLESGAA